MRKTLLGIVTGVTIASIGLVIACDSTSPTNPTRAGAERLLTPAPAIQPPRDASGNFSNPYRLYGEWHNALLDRAIKAGRPVKDAGGTDAQRDSVALQASSALYRSRFTMTDAEFRAHSNAGMEQANKLPNGPYRLYTDPNLNAKLAATVATGKMSPKQAQYARRLAAIADGARNTDELRLSLALFDKKVYDDLGPDQSAPVLVPSAVLNSSANYWTAAAINSHKANPKNGRMLSASADVGDCLPTDIICDGVPSPPPSDSGWFTVSADAGYLTNGYGDTLVVVVMDTVVISASDAGTLKGFYQADGLGALEGGAVALYTGCELYTAGVCAAGAGLIVGGIQSYGYTLAHPGTFNGGGGAGSPSSNCGSDAYPWYNPTIQAIVCKPYPSAIP